MPIRETMPELSPAILPGEFTRTGEPMEVRADAFDVVAAAARRDNTVASTLSYVGPGDEDIGFDPDFSPWDAIADTKYQPLALRFSGLRTRSAVEKMKAQIDMEGRDSRILENAGWFGVAASMAAAVIDLPTLLPGGAVVRSAKGGFSALKSSAAIGTAAGASAAVSETVLQSTQETRTEAETALAIGGSVILGMALGAGAARISSSQFQAASRQIDEDLPRMAAEVNQEVQSIGAAQATPTNLNLRREKMFQAIKKTPLVGLLVKADPLIRGVTSELNSVRAANAALFDTPLQYEVNLQGGAITPGGSWEQRINARYHTELSQAQSKLQTIYSTYFFDGPVGLVGRLSAPLAGKSAHLMGHKGKLTFNNFLEEVGRAAVRGDQHAIPQVAEAAQYLRANIFQKTADELVDLGFWDNMPTLKHGDTYVTRIYNREKISAQFDVFVSRLAGHFKADQHAKALADPDFTPMDDLEIRASAENAASNIINLNEGQHPISVSMANPLHARVLDVPDQLIEDWLERDVSIILDRYFKSLVPDIELARQFGLRNPTKAKTEERPGIQGTINSIMENVTEEAKRMASAAKSEKESKRILDEAKFRIDDLRHMIDRVRGSFAVPENPKNLGTRAIRSAKTVSYAGYLGGMMISAIPDVAHIIGRGNAAAFGDGMIDLMNAPTRVLKAKDDVLDFGSAAEWWLDSRNVAIADIMDPYGLNTGFERGLAAVGQGFSKATGMTQWNVAFKTIGGMVAMSRILKAAAAVKAGKATKKQLLALGENNIDRTLAVKIADQMTQHGDANGRLWIAQGKNWTNAEAKKAFQVALNREMDLMVITPGQDKPLFLSREWPGLFGQFKSFAFSANHRIFLSGLQRADGHVAGGVALALLMGGMVSHIKSWQFDKPAKEGPALWIDALDRSGLTGVMFEANALAELAGIGVSKISGGELPSRFQSRDALLGLAGPTVSTANNIAQLSLAAQRGDVRQSDVGKALNIMPGNNLPYLLWLNEQIERGVTSAMGGKLREEKR